ncbi:fibrinogen C domain-containing protein 1-like isoform X2 [Epargyreus clarus]|uniref:fibrinogen C domain-containing protein 1-like isoform X2 n=1 Tax=Epargyreus clarus TaxID=520877 RepID=UPI003C2EBC4F
MVRIVTIFQMVLVTLTAVTGEVSGDRKGRRKNDSPEKSLWKKEYEDELTDAMLSSKKKDNFTRVPQSTSMSDNEMVIEKLMDSITSSEKYLKKVDSVDFRLNRLDIEVHEKTNAILKRLTEIIKSIEAHPYEDKIDTAIDSIKNDVGHIKGMLEHSPRADGTSYEGTQYRVDPTLDNRLSFLENHVKAILTGVDSIASVISEVKSRQSSRNLQKTEGSSFDAVSLISEFRRALHDQKSRKCDCKIGRVDRVERYPTDCYEIQIQGFNVSGIYKIKPDDMEPFYVLCDLNTAGGGWTVFQNRFDGSQDFYKSWPEYKHGFGNLAGEFWLGLEKLNFLTNQKLYELRIEMESQLGQEAFAAYSVFTIGPEHEGYRISTLGAFHGSAGDSLSYHAGQKFSTYDFDNDEWKDGSCASEHGGAWWYKECDKSNLNGKYSMNTEEQQGQSIYWISFKGPTTPLTKTRMMLRPLPASRPVDFSENSRKIDTSKLRPIGDKKGIRKSEPKGTYEATLGRAPYRYEDTAHGDAFFPSYA